MKYLIYLSCFIASSLFAQDGSVTVYKLKLPTEEKTTWLLPPPLHSSYLNMAIKPDLQGEKEFNGSVGLNMNHIFHNPGKQNQWIASWYVQLDFSDMANQTSWARPNAPAHEIDMTNNTVDPEVLSVQMGLALDRPIVWDRNHNGQVDENDLIFGAGLSLGVRPWFSQKFAGGIESRSQEFLPSSEVIRKGAVPTLGTKVYVYFPKKRAYFIGYIDATNQLQITTRLLMEINLNKKGTMSVGFERVQVDTPVEMSEEAKGKMIAETYRYTFSFRPHPKNRSILYSMGVSRENSVAPFYQAQEDKVYSNIYAGTLNPYVRVQIPLFQNSKKKQ